LDLNAKVADLSELSAGMYYLQVQHKNGLEQVKIVKR
jgi:hypothetical protein